MKCASDPSEYRYWSLRVSVRTGRNFSPARKVLSMTAPSVVRLSLVRTNAPPLPGLTCWNSTILKTVPSTSIWVPFLNWLVLITPRNGSRSGRPRLKSRPLPLDSYPVAPSTLPARVRAHAALAVASLAIASGVVAIAQPTLGDYGTAHMGSNPDNAAPAMAAIARGDLARVPHVQPVMGPVSLVVRAPFAALGQALGGRTLEYGLGAVACLWALAALALVLAGRVRRRDGGVVAPAAVVLLLVANPLTLGALDAGHPEEVL